MIKVWFVFSHLVAAYAAYKVGDWSHAMLWLQQILKR
jgi:hypothetical protein